MGGGGGWRRAVGGGRYRAALQRVKLHGPTLFQGILGEAVSKAMAGDHEISQMNQQYTVLLILTDGIINDMEATIDSLIEASGLPLSVIVVGVGPEKC